MHQNVHEFSGRVTNVETAYIPRFVCQIVLDFAAKAFCALKYFIHIINFYGHIRNRSSRAAFASNAKLNWSGFFRFQRYDPTEIHGNVEFEEINIELPNRRNRLRGYVDDNSLYFHYPGSGKL